MLEIMEGTISHGMKALRFKGIVRLGDS